MWVFQSYTNPAHKCDVKCFIAIQHLRERRAFSSTSPTSQRAYNILLKQSNISENGQLSPQAVQHLREQSIFLRERSTFSSSSPTSQRAVSILLKQFNISESDQHCHQAVQHLRERPTFLSSSPTSQRAINVLLKQSTCQRAINILILSERPTFSSSCPKSQRAANISLQQSNISVSGQHSPPEVQILVYLHLWCFLKKKNRSSENQISYKFILHQLTAFEHYYLKKD